MKLPSLTLATLVLGMIACGAPRTAASPPAPPPKKVEVAPPPAPDDEEEESGGMAVQGLKGHLETADIQPVIQGSWDAVMACYQDNGAREQRYLDGQLELAFRVARDGSVKRVAINGASDLGAWPVEKCVLGLAASMHFPRPQGGEAQFSFPIKFSGRGHLNPMDETWARTELGKQMAKLTECHGASGAVKITFYVGPGGKVTQAGFAATGPEPLAVDFAECAHDHALKWKLKDPRGAVRKATVTWGK